MPNPKTLGIDPGAKWGWALASDTKTAEASGSSSFRSLHGLYLELAALLDQWKPAAVIACRPFGRHQSVIRKHSAMLAILELLCEKRRICYCEKADSKLRSDLLGTQKLTKAQVIALTGAGDEHAADASVAARWGCMYLDFSEKE